MPRNPPGYYREYYLKNRERILERVKAYDQTLRGITARAKKTMNQGAKRRHAQ